jgi:hypothetical protein
LWPTRWLDAEEHIQRNGGDECSDGDRRYRHQTNVTAGMEVPVPLADKGNGGSHSGPFPCDFQGQHLQIDFVQALETSLWKIN